MDSYEFDAIKIEKAKAMQRYRTFKKIATIVRSLEIFVVVVLISWSVFRSSAYLPVAINFSGAFLRRVSSLLFCPHFVFLLGNAIIITLFANSREKTSSEKSVRDEIFSVSAADSISAEKSGGGDVEESEPEVAKAVVYVPPPPAETAIVEVAEKREPEVVVKAVEEETRTYRRSQSAVEKVIGEEEVKEKIELRRSRTVPRRKIGDGEAAMAARRRRMSDVDDLSSEEFRRRVEAFIEKQQKFLREESKALVLTN
ncbi:hypothetical protein Cgig2_004399 [Carnegiea gigantea]|uniref:DUF4408 domain-containing protein n=1 Tax=Carnegiea gigantea TaxID=171969 RepID=A0A9Q1JRQ2_9CARY|nr:hypothetical protein Cgig2_004399 [Carnegiea gigantea]